MKILAYWLKVAWKVCPPHSVGKFPVPWLTYEWIEINLFQERQIFSRNDLRVRRIKDEVDTADKNTQNPDLSAFGSFPLRSLMYCRAVTRWSLALVASSNMTSLNPGASAPWRKTCSCTRWYLAQISKGRGSSFNFKRNGTPRMVVTIPTHKPIWEQIWSSSSDVRPRDSRRR